MGRVRVCDICGEILEDEPGRRMIKIFETDPEKEARDVRTVMTFDTHIDCSKRLIEWIKTARIDAK